MLNFMPTKYRTRVLLAPQTTANAAGVYAAPTAGSSAINIRATALMANAADLVLSVAYADDAAGTNAAAFPVSVEIYKNGVRQTAAKTFTIGDATGNHVVDFCIDPLTVPAGKFVGVSYANSNAANLLTTAIIEDVMYKPTAA